MSLPTDYDARKALPIYSFLTQYFPDAIVELVKVSVEGNKQHNPGEPLHWARGKSMDQLNTAQRHLFDHGAGTVYDTDGTMHLAKAAWRLLAEVQLLVEKRQAAQQAWNACSKPDIPRSRPVLDTTRGLVHAFKCDTSIGLDCDCTAREDWLRVGAKGLVDYLAQGAVSSESNPPTPKR